MKNLFFILFLSVILLSCQKIPFEKGDEFIVRKSGGKYTTWRIDSISRREVWYTESDFEVADSTYLDSLSGYTRYTDKPYRMKVKDFISLTLTPYHLKKHKP